MKKIISITLVLSMVLSLMTFGTFTASADDDFVNYTIYNDFSVASSDALGLYDGLFKAGNSHNTNNILHGTVGGAARYGHIANIGKSVLQFPVDIAGKTSPVIVEWSAKQVGSSKNYAPVYGGAAGGTASATYKGLDGQNAGVSSLALTNGTATDDATKYRFVIDPEENTITPYMGDVEKTSTVVLTEGQEKVYLGHQASVWHKAVTEVSALEKYFDIYYTAVYDDAETPDFQVVGYDTTSAVVQFNTPVTLDTVKAMTVDGDTVASATDITATTEEVETYSITFDSALTEGVHTIVATGKSLTGNIINASKVIDIALVEPLLVGNVVLNSVENAFLQKGATIETTAASGGEFSLEADGALRFAQTDAATSANVRFKSVPLNPNGDQTGKVVVDFDIATNRTTNTINFKYGSTENVSGRDNLHNEQPGVNAGRIVNYKIVIDYETKAYSVYKNGVQKELAGTTTTQFTNKDAAIMLWLDRVESPDNSEIGYVTIKNFAAYKIPSSTLEYEVVESVAKDGGKAVQFTMPVDTAASVATINGKQYGLVNAHKSGFVNAYAVDTAALDAGTYDVTLNAVALEDSTKTATVNFQITLTGDKVIFTNSSATIDEELSGRVTVTAENNRNSEIRPMLLVAEYDSQDVFDDVDSVSTYVNAYDTVVLSGKNNVNEGSYIKGYIWDSITSAKPYCAAIEQ